MAEQTNSWVSTRQTKFAAYTAVYVLIVLAVLGVLNFLANRYNKSYDATGNKQFTLSDQTVKIAKDLKQDVTITYWDRPTSFQAARDLLDRYKNLSPKINVSRGRSSPNTCDKSFGAELPSSAFTAVTTTTISSNPRIPTSK